MDESLVDKIQRMIDLVDDIQWLKSQWQSKVVLIPRAAIQIAIFEAQLWKIMIQSHDVWIKC